ncbi:MarR family transcriptional regulator [Nguyenibacter vanlangensis]|uniref:MarR family transcriptional regulator n=1 Tax=Nguyenibacter vanlangensis TaxID=1216886 RepID=A0ABZ3D072_9PROT
MQNGGDDTAITLGRMLAQIARRWRHILNTRLLPYGLTDATWQPLLELSRQNRPMSQQEIADALLLDKSSVVRTLRALEALDLITRIPDARDGRAYCIVLTGTGHERIETVLQAASGIEEEVIEKLGSHGSVAKEIFGEILDIIVRMKL